MKYRSFFFRIRRKGRATTPCLGNICISESNKNLVWKISHAFTAFSLRHNFLTSMYSIHLKKNFFKDIYYNKRGVLGFSMGGTREPTPKKTPLFYSLNNLGICFWKKYRNKIRMPSSSPYPYSNFFSLTWSSVWNTQQTTQAENAKKLPVSREKVSRTRRSQFVPQGCETTLFQLHTVETKSGYNINARVMPVCVFTFTLV